MIRATFIILALSVALAGYGFAPSIVTDALRLNYLSYWGTLITLIGLLLTIGEILHSLKMTRSVQEQALALLQSVHCVENASTISDCLASVDLLTQDLMQEKYPACVVHFQYLRRLLVKNIPSLDEAPAAETRPILNLLVAIEFELLKANQIRGSAYLSKPQKTALLKKLLQLKQQLEAKNPAKRAE